MGQEIIRTALVTAVEAAKVGSPVTDLVICYDNAEHHDPQTQSAPYLEASVVFKDAEQADLAAKPIHRFYGMLVLSAVVKEGAGMGGALRLLDHFMPQLQGKSFNGVRTYAGKVAPSRKHKGLVYYPIMFPFWYDKTY